MSKGGALTHVNSDTHALINIEKKGCQYIGVLRKHHS